MKKNIQEISDQKKCFGCFLCGDICPTSAIAFQEDPEGFMYPFVADDKCIDCGLCLQKCPVTNNVEDENNEDVIVYAAWHKNKKVLADSTSGGMFPAFSDFVIQQGGVVFGAKFNDEMVLHHASTSCQAGIDKMKGSKYLQSNCSGVFKKIKADLKAEKKVLFSGTPCQVAAVKSFFGHHDNLFLIDIICHGVNSPGVFKVYKEFLEKKHNDKLIGFNFRDKRFGWMLTKVKIFFKSKQISRVFDIDSFISGFRKNIYLRPACYACPYTKTPRPGDVTIGDFWGVPKKYYNRDGVSCLFINSKKGEVIFNSIGKSVVVYKSDFNTVVKKNPQLRKPVARTPKIDRMRSDFFKLLNEGEAQFAFTRFVYGFPFPLLRKYRYYYKFLKKVIKYN